MTAGWRRVTIVQERLPDYRVPFFLALNEALHRERVRLELLVGDHDGDGKRDSGEVPWAVSVPLRTYKIGGRSLTRHSLPARTLTTDLVIVEQASRHLSTYALLARRLAHGRPTLAWWGHGANLQAGDSTSVAVEVIKRWVTRRGDAALAYTEGSATRFRRAGLGAENVFVVNNSVDTSWAQGISLTPDTRNRVLFVGALYDHKRLDLALATGDRLSRDLPDFRLDVLGDGPLRDMLDSAKRTRPWLVIHGRSQGQLKRDLFEKASLLLNPGLVGLVAVDSLAAGRPIVTRRHALHSPEFEYLSDNNALIVEDASEVAYTQAVAGLLADPFRREGLSLRARQDAQLYTLDEMVWRFSTAVVRMIRPQT